MRLVLGIAMVAALFDAVACNAGLGGDQLPEGGPAATSDASVDSSTDGGGSEESEPAADTNASNAGDATSDIGDATSDTDEGAPDCGALAAPTSWSGWVMPNPKASGLPNPASYTVSTSGNQVADDLTGLVWQRNIEARTYTWDEAKQYCACLTIDGITGWRLPARIELVSIADWTKSGPSIDSNAFPNTPSESFWTSSLLSSDPMLGYIVYFANGHTSYVDLGFTYNARCVRSGQSPATAPPGRYTIANGTVYDTVTKLTWQQEISTSSYTWADAKAYCSLLSLDGTGWRLPATNEIQTIVDESTNPSIDGAAFPMTPSDYFWTSSIVVEDPSRAWTCFFTNGSTYSFVATASKNARCVR